MIRLKKTGEEDNYGYPYYDLYFNGQFIEYERDKLAIPPDSIDFKDTKFIQQITFNDLIEGDAYSVNSKKQYAVSNFLPKQLFFSKTEEFESCFIEVDILASREHRGIKQELSFRGIPLSLKKHFNHVYNYERFRIVLIRYLNKISGLRFDSQSHLLDIDIIPLDKFIWDIIEEVIESVFQAYKKTTSEIISQMDTDAFIFTLTDFPPEFRTACIQYLQYFADFLTDLGVEAKTSVLPEDDHTLLKVIPEDKTISLQKIHDALEVYLELPKSSQVFAENEKNKIREMKYIQQVRDLEAKLNTYYMLSEKDKELADKDKKIIQMLALFNDSLMEDKAEAKKKDDEKKSLIKGVVKLGKLKIKDGVEVDLVRALEVTKLDVIFDQLEEYLNSDDVTQLKLTD